MGINQEIFAKIMDDKSFGDVVKAWVLKKVYVRRNEEQLRLIPWNSRNQPYLRNQDRKPLKNSLSADR